MNNNNSSPRVQSFALSDKGRRPNNEDFVTSFEPTDPKELKASGCIYIVADGVGGAAIGERASKYAAEKVLYEYLQHPEIEPATRLKQAITKANHDIFEYAGGKGIRMATTMTVAIIIGRSLIAANVGDSRIYLIRGSEVRQVTRDHNIVGELVRDGEMTEAEALKSKAKNRLTRSIGGQEDVYVDVFDPIPLQPDDKVLLCSDGLTRYALKEDIAHIASTGSSEEIANNAMEFAKKRGHGGADNISVITVTYEPSSQLKTTAHYDTRPVEPVQPWEIMETDLGFKSRRPKVWLLGATVGLGLLLVLVIGGFYLMGGNNITGQPDLTQSILPSSKSENTQTQPLATEASTEENPTVENGDLTNTETAALIGVVKEDCPKFINIREFPSRSDDTAQVIGTLDCGEKVTLLGKFTDDKDTWFLIDFQDPTTGNKVSAWVIGSSVDVPADILEILQIVTLTPQIPTAIPTLTAEPTLIVVTEPAEIIYCEYVVKSGDSLTNIAKRFGLDNYSRITCAPYSPGACNLSNPYIYAGWILIIPDVNRDICVQNGGQPQ